LTAIGRTKITANCNRLFQFLLALPVFLAAHAFAFQNEPTGFRGIEWGTEFSKIADQFERPVAPNSTIYRRKNDKLSMGAASLESLRYSFYKGKFAGVFIRAKMTTNGRLLMDALRAQFGEGRQPDRASQEYFWDGEIGSVVLDCDAVKDECSLGIFSAAAMKQRDADTKGSGKGNF
jgi:hypothetical protein